MIGSWPIAERLTADCIASTEQKLRTMDFKERLHRAAERGQHARDEKAREEAAKALSQEECRRLHGAYRLELTEHIESCLKQLADNFPGFRYSPVMDEKGWGSMVSRDDFTMSGGRRDSLFSRFSMTVSPHNDFHVLEVIAKGTIHNKEVFTRNHYQLLHEADLDGFQHLIEQWTLEYAEQFAAKE